MKRTSDHQLTKDNADDANAAADEPQQGFERAPPEVLAKRRILKARRTQTVRPLAAPRGPNPFAGLAKAAEAVPSKPAEAPADKPADTPDDSAEKAAEAQAEKRSEAPAEKPTEAPADKPADKPAEVLEEKASDIPAEKPVESAAPPSGNTNAAGPAKADPAPAPESSTTIPTTETPSNHTDSTPLDQSKPAPPPSAPQPTPAPLKPATTPANGTPKPAIIFGSTTKPITFASAAQSDGFNFKSAEAPPKVEEKKPEFKEATVLTGEEKDKELFRTRAKLFTLETAETGARWKERGVGALKLNKNTETGKARLLMRTEATLRVVLNTPVFKGFQMDRATDRSIRFQGFDVYDEKKTTSFLARFTAKDVTSDMIEAIEKCKKDIK